MYENVSTFSALSGDGHRLLWSGFVLVWYQAVAMLYLSSYLDNQTF